MKRKHKDIMREAMPVRSKLSPHFTRNEFLRSQTAERKGIKNIPDRDQVYNMRALCSNLLEEIRSGIRKEIKSDALVIITSGFRCKKLNKAIGGSKTSQHMKGQAADLHISGVSLFDAFKYIVSESGLQFDKCVWEFGSWIHISYSMYGNNRNEILSVNKVNSKNKWKLLDKCEVRNMQSEDELKWN